MNAGFLRASRAGNLEKVLEYLNENIDINISNSVNILMKLEIIVIYSWVKYIIIIIIIRMD